MILQVLGTDSALRLNDNSLLNLVNAFDWAPNFNAQDIFELGTTTKIDTSMELETSGSFDMSAIGNTAGLLARMAVTRDGSGNFTGYMYDSGGAAGKNGYTLTQDDLAELKFDLILHEKTDQKNFNRSLYLPGCYLTGFSGKVDANGNASETYNWAGSFVTGFPKPFHDIRSIYATRTTSTTATLYDTSVSTSTHTLAFVNIDGKFITNKTTDPTYATLGASGVVTITTTEGYQIPAGAYIQACVYKTAGSSVFPTASAGDRFSTTTNIPINYVKGYMANVYIAPVVAGSPAATEQWLKVQTMDWSIDLKVETLRQIALNLAGTSIYARVPTYPLAITTNCTVIESDWSDWKATLNKSFTGPNVSDNTYDFSPENLKSEFAVVVEYYTKSGSKIQTWQFTDMRVDGYGTRKSVGGRGEVSWSLKGTAFQLIGVNP